MTNQFSVLPRAVGMSCSWSMARETGPTGPTQRGVKAGLASLGAFQAFKINPPLHPFARGRWFPSCRLLERTGMVVLLLLRFGAPALIPGPFPWETIPAMGYLCTQRPCWPVGQFRLPPSLKL